MTAQELRRTAAGIYDDPAQTETMLRLVFDAAIRIEVLENENARLREELGTLKAGLEAHSIWEDEWIRKRSQKTEL